MKTAIDFANAIKAIDPTAVVNLDLDEDNLYILPDDEFRNEVGTEYTYSRYLDALVSGIQSQWDRDTEHVTDSLGEDISNPVAYFQLPSDYLRVLEMLKDAAQSIALAMPETG